jgi:hypothetical protein
VAAGLLLGATTTLMLRTATDWAAPTAAHADASKASDAKTQPVAKKSIAKPAVSARPAAKESAKKAVAKPAKAKTSTKRTLTQVDDQVSYQYNALGRRDPFQALVGGVYVGADVGGDAPPDIGGIQVVGIVWGARDRFALVEDPRGNSLVLRRGDKLMNGVVKSLRRDALVVEHSVDGLSQIVTIPLTKKGEKNAAH